MASNFTTHTGYPSWPPDLDPPAPTHGARTRNEEAEDRGRDESNRERRERGGEVGTGKREDDEETKRTTQKREHGRRETG